MSTNRCTDNAVCILLTKVVHKRMRQVIVFPLVVAIKIRVFSPLAYLSVSLVSYDLLSRTYSISTLTVWAMSP